MTRRRPPLHLIVSNARTEVPHEDPMIAAIEHYVHGIDGIDHPDLTDEDVSRQFSAALAPIQASPGPKATTPEGAAMALRMALGFDGMDATDRALVAGALHYLEGRCR